jgi:hypothetical protein
MEKKMEHKEKSPHVNKLMGGHKSESHSPANKLMGQHHYEGGISKAMSKFSHGGESCQKAEHHYEGGMSKAVPRFRKGGKARRYEEGGRAEEKGSTKPLKSHFRTGGHALGGSRHERHAFGDRVGKLSENMNDFGEKAKAGIKKGVSETKEFGNRLKYAFNPKGAERRSRGGSTRHHAPREHHFFGELIGGLAIPAITAAVQGIKRGVQKKKENKAAAEYGTSHGDRTYQTMLDNGKNKRKALRAAADSGRQLYQRNAQDEEDAKQQVMMNRAVQNRDQYSRGQYPRDQYHGFYAAGGSGKIRHGVMSAKGRPLRPRSI